MLALRPRRFALAASALPLLLCATPVFANEQPNPSERPESSSRTIIVTAPRGALRGINADRSVDADLVASYGVSTVDELVNALAEESGEDQPVVIVNGERVDDYGDVSDLPVEAIERVDILPRGAGGRVGAPTTGRVFNIVLRRELRTVIAAGAYSFATEGDWSARTGELVVTRIQGPNRLNMLFRIRGEDRLLESDRGIIQPEPRFPYAVLGNVIPDPRTGAAEIDPVLSMLAGRPVSVAAAPASQARLGLPDFLLGANSANLDDLGRFRTLRPESTTYELTVSAVNRLSPWLTSSLNGRVHYADSASLSGLATGLFLLPATSPASPFSRDVGIAAARAAPLGQSYNTLTSSLSGTLNATVGAWHVSLLGSYSHTDRRFATQRQNFAQVAGAIVIEPALNPFAGTLGELLDVGTDRAKSITEGAVAQLTATGSPVQLPAGPVRLTVSGGLATNENTSQNSFGGVQSRRQFSRSERNASVILAVPLASRRSDFLPFVGELNANFEYGASDIRGIGTLSRFAAGLDWAPENRLRFFASIQQNRTAPAIELLADPVVTTPGVRYFDFLTGRTTDVTQTYGGNPALLPQTVSVRRFAVNAAPMPRINLQLTAEYLSTRTRNLISGLPPASAAVLLAFPDRFVRDADGILTSVDVRPTNFTRQRHDQLRYGFSLTVPIGPAPGARSAGTAEASTSDPGEGGAQPIPGGGPRPRLQLIANHTLLLNNDILIRPGLPLVNLLDGGAIGISGGRPRHQVDFSLALTARGVGARLTGLWRSESTLEIRQGASIGRLRFEPLMLLNFTGFVEGRRFFPDADFLRGSRFTVSVTNITNRRQNVTDELGFTPLQYQPGYRDAVGRTVELGLRKAF